MLGTCGLSSTSSSDEDSTRRTCSGSVEDCVFIVGVETTGEKEP
jgi:hypothetical protein